MIQKEQKCQKETDVMRWRGDEVTNQIDELSWTLQCTSGRCLQRTSGRCSHSCFPTNDITHSFKRRSHQQYNVFTHKREPPPSQPLCFQVGVYLGKHY